MWAVGKRRLTRHRIRGWLEKRLGLDNDGKTDALNGLLL